MAKEEPCVIPDNQWQRLKYNHGERVIVSAVVSILLTAIAAVLCEFTHSFWWFAMPVVVLFICIASFVIEFAVWPRLAEEYPDEEDKD